MRIEHIAVWTRHLERLRQFYQHYFDARAGDLYRSANGPGFTSYFLSFPGGGVRVELMQLPALADASAAPAVGYAHLALSVGSRAAVESLVAKMADDGVRIVSPPRMTGDGYFEAVVEDPDGNHIELTV